MPVLQDIDHTNRAVVINILKFKKQFMQNF